MRKTINGTPTVLSSSISQSPGILTATKFKFGFHQYGKPVARDSNANAKSSSQVRQPYVNPSSSTGTFVAETTQNFVDAK